MMRSLFSGVAGLRVHQTRMDVIGNNIANVNTTSYKSQSMVFSDLLYQTTQSASAANATTGRGGINARQIGLGAKTGAISTAITTQGSAQSTNNPFDVMITGDSFFVVSNGSENFFTRDGSFTVDGAGNLVMSSTGYTVMGWQTDPETGEILPDVVSALKIMSAENLTYPPESTTRAYASGTVDKNDTALSSEAGKVFTLNFFDKRGYSYTAKFSIHKTETEDNYNVRLDDIMDGTGTSLVKKYNLGDINEIAVFGGTSSPTTEKIYEALAGVTYNKDTKEYKQDLSAGSILKDFDTNAMIKLAESWQITTTGDVAADGDVTVTGTVKLDKDTLEKEPFNLMFVSDGTTYKYIKGTGTDADLNSVDKWTAALKELNVSGIGAVPTVDADGNVTLNFTQTFKATRAATVKDTKTFTAGITQMEAFGVKDEGDVTYNIDYTSPDGLKAQIQRTVTTTGNALVFDTESGEFVYVGSPEHDSVTMGFRASATSRDGQPVDLSYFTDIDIDFSLTDSYNNGGVSTASAVSGDKGGNNIGAGRKVGEMNGIEIAQDGKITAYYDNSQSKLLGQIAVANFANPAGLAKQGDNLYSATSNSGEFDGIGDDITANGDGYMTSGVLEMSNVDLSAEFTEMITTQRGFQANSRIITVSDTLLEELVNLKR